MEDVERRIVAMGLPEPSEELEARLGLLFAPPLPRPATDRRSGSRRTALATAAALVVAFVAGRWSAEIRTGDSARPEQAISPIHPRTQGAFYTGRANLAMNDDQFARLVGGSNDGERAFGRGRLVVEQIPLNGVNLP